MGQLKLLCIIKIPQMFKKFSVDYTHFYGSAEIVMDHKDSTNV